ncbi:MAG: hypothetical protein P8013_12920 [Candidatus Sulfobium sp.]|jgi:hypothetical protein
MHTPENDGEPAVLLVFLQTHKKRFQPDIFCFAKALLPGGVTNKTLRALQPIKDFSQLLLIVLLKPFFHVCAS